MSNCEIFTLPPVDLEPHQFREVLRCIVHTILFNRALGYVKPQDVDSELFDITYVTCGDAEVCRRVEGLLGGLCPQVERALGDTVQVVLSFFERRRRQAWFGAKDERLYWEQWVLPLNVLSPNTAVCGSAPVGGQGVPSAAQRSMHAAAGPARGRPSSPAPFGDHSILQAQVEAAMTAVARSVNDRRDHIPPVVSSSIVTFPFDLTLTQAGSSRGSAFGLNAMKKMLLQTSPPPML